MMKAGHGRIRRNAVAAALTNATERSAAVAPNVNVDAPEFTQMAAGEISSWTKLALDLGYFDQPHLTRALKRFIGKTPAQIINKTESEQMSLLFKTEP